MVTVHRFRSLKTDHGILDAELGYQIDISDLEESLSVSYSLNYDTEALAATLSAAHSRVDNLASLEETAAGVPILTQLDDTAHVSTVDFTAGYNITENLTVNFGAEKFFYDDNFKSSYAIAPIQERASIEIDYSMGNLNVYWSTVWFGSVDLSEYGYEGYNKLGDPSSIKTTDAPAYSSSDLKVQYKLSKAMKLYAGISNIFEYTQIEEGDTPLFYDADGGYDVAYIYGPLHGREFYAGIEVKL